MYLHNMRREIYPLYYESREKILPNFYFSYKRLWRLWHLTCLTGALTCFMLSKQPISGFAVERTSMINYERTVFDFLHINKDMYYSAFISCLLKKTHRIKTYISVVFLRKMKNMHIQLVWIKCVYSHYTTVHIFRYSGHWCYKTEQKLNSELTWIIIDRLNCLNTMFSPKYYAILPRNIYHEL